jgi:hypothetical protein
MKRLIFGTMAALVSWSMVAVLHAQTTTTNCTLIGNQANCTSTSDAQAQAQQQEQQRENDEAMRNAGTAIGQGLGNMMAARKNRKTLERYCSQHPGEYWTWGNQHGECPGTMSEAYARQHLIDASKFSARKTGLAIYTTVDGPVLTTHSERASETRLHMVVADDNWNRAVTAAHITTFVYTNDKDVNLTYDLRINQLVKPEVKIGANNAR